MVLLSVALPLWIFLLPLCTVKLWGLIYSSPFQGYSPWEAPSLWPRNITEAMKPPRWCSVPGPSRQLLLLLSPEAFFSHCCIQTSFCNPCLWSLELTPVVWLLSVVITLLEIFWLFIWTYKRCSTFTSASSCRQILLAQNSQGSQRSSANCNLFLNASNASGLCQGWCSWRNGRSRRTKPEDFNSFTLFVLNTWLLTPPYWSNCKTDWFKNYSNMAFE